MAYEGKLYTNGGMEVHTFPEATGVCILPELLTTSPREEVRVDVFL